MIAILLVVTALLIIVGATNWAAKLGRLVVALIVLVTLLPCLLQSCREGGRAMAGSVPAEELLIMAGVLVLALVGYLLWRGREGQERRRQAELRRDGHARGRALPPPR